MLSPVPGLPPDFLSKLILGDDESYAEDTSESIGLRTLYAVDESRVSAGNLSARVSTPTEEERLSKEERRAAYANRLNASGNRQGMHGYYPGKAQQDPIPSNAPSMSSIVEGEVEADDIETDAMPPSNETIDKALEIFSAPSDLHPGARCIQRIQGRNRALLLLLAQGYNNRQAEMFFAARGIKFNRVNIGKTARSPLFQAELARLQNKCAERVIEETYITADMVSDSLRLLHASVNGIIPATRLDDDGKPMSGETTYEAVAPKDRIKASTELLNRVPATAPVTREMSNAGRGMIQPDDLAAIRDHLSRTREAIAVTPRVLKSSEDSDTLSVGVG